MSSRLITTTPAPGSLLLHIANLPSSSCLTATQSVVELKLDFRHWTPPILTQFISGPLCPRLAAVQSLANRNSIDSSGVNAASVRRSNNNECSYTLSRPST